MTTGRLKQENKASRKRMHLVKRDRERRKHETRQHQKQRMRLPLDWGIRISSIATDLWIVTASRKALKQALEAPCLLRLDHFQ